MFRPAVAADSGRRPALPSRAGAERRYQNGGDAIPMTSPFDTSDAAHLNCKRKEFVLPILDALIRAHNLRTALDVGCGFGFFSQVLADLGFKVSAIDARPANVSAAKARIPGVDFRVGDIEAAALDDLGVYDLVYCVGVLYHLENPLRALRNLVALTGKVLLIETVIAPFKSQMAVLCEEPKLANQGVNYVACVPTESWFIKSLYRVGFPLVYRTKALPGHRDFRSNLIRKRRRTILFASRVRLEHPVLRPASEPPATNPHLWDRRGLSPFLKHEGLRALLRSVRMLVRPGDRREVERVISHSNPD